MADKIISDSQNAVKARLALADKIAELAPKVGSGEGSPPMAEWILQLAQAFAHLSPIVGRED